MRIDLSLLDSGHSARHYTDDDADRLGCRTWPTRGARTTNSSPLANSAVISISMRAADGLQVACSKPARSHSAVPSSSICFRRVLCVLSTSPQITGRIILVSGACKTKKWGRPRYSRVTLDSSG